MNALTILPMQANQGNPFQQADLLDPIEEVLEALRQGQLVIVTDDAQRENEGDLILAAEKATANDAQIDGARRQRSELGRHGHARPYIESLFLQVANARRKAEAQQTAHGKDMIGEAAGVGVVFVNGGFCISPQKGSIQDFESTRE